MARTVGALMNSSLFCAYFIAYGDGFHLSKGVTEAFPIDDAVISDLALCDLNERLKGFSSKTRGTSRSRRAAATPEFHASEAKPIIDCIDDRLGELYCFTGDELVLSSICDVKFRLGLKAVA